MGHHPIVIEVIGIHLWLTSCCDHRRRPWRRTKEMGFPLEAAAAALSASGTVAGWPGGVWEKNEILT